VSYRLVLEWSASQPFTYQTGWNATDDGPWFDVMNDDSAGCDDRAFAHMHSVSDRAVPTDIRTATYPYVGRNITELRIGGILSLPKDRHSRCNHGSILNVYAYSLD
jgi:hypothetical protein